jgi:Uma2 family endonuclease
MATTTIRLTVDELDFIPEERIGDRHELIDGELIVTPVPVTKHQRICVNLTLALGNYVHGEALGEVHSAPSGVRLRDDTLVIPDLCYVAQERLGIIGEKTIDGPPDLVVEVLSPGTRRRDLGTKKSLYARFGVLEYWVIDPETKSVVVLTLEDGQYESVSLGLDGAIRSRVLPSLVLKIERIFARAT